MNRCLLLPVALLALALSIVVGCAARSPVAPDIDSSASQPVQKAQSIYDERYRLWGEWTFSIDETHERIDMVPRREGRVHVNVLKWLEEDCADCLEILYIQNNGDSTIDLAVRIRHPRPGQPELTGFDVKGIVMFDGSHELHSNRHLPPYPEPFRISWRGAGDPEVLNPDGYTVRWSPSYDSGSSLPLLNYWPGKYSSGTPTANLNAYLNFYTTKQRHMFSHTGVVTRIYHIYLPPGPVVAGYAVEACWVPPDKIPVTNPLEDFPISANQDEPYHFRFVINNDEPITHHKCCGWNRDNECEDMHLEILQWGGRTVNGALTIQPPPHPYPDKDWGQCHSIQNDCSDDDPPEWFGIDPLELSWYPDGTYRGVVIVQYGWVDYDHGGRIVREHIGYDVFDFTVDLED